MKETNVKPKIKTAQKYKDLTRKQRMQIRVRKASKNSLLGTILLAIFMFAAFIVLSYVFQDITPVTADNDIGNNNALVMDFSGDVMLGRNIETASQGKGYDFLYDGVLKYWDKADLVGVNLECAVLKDDVSAYEEADKKIHIYCEYEAVDSLVNAGVNLLSCANNHSYDYCEKAVKELVSYLDKTRVYYAGIGLDAPSAAAYKIVEVNGIKIAFMSVTDVFYKEDQASETNAGILTTLYGNYGWLIHEASQKADITVVYMHWGDENEISASEEQQTIGHRLIDQGADIVIGSHPHVLQEAECYKDGVIFYSLGNFIFDQGNTFSKDTALVQMVVSDDGECSFEVVPMRIRNFAPSEALSIFAKRINKKITDGLDPSEYYYNDAGHIVIPAFKVDLTKDKEPELNTPQQIIAAGASRANSGTAAGVGAVGTQGN